MLNQCVVPLRQTKKGFSYVTQNDLVQQRMQIESRRGETRPTFYIKFQQVRASGILFYKVENGKLLFLLRKEIDAQKEEKLKYADLGGKTAMTDKSILEVAQRKAKLESHDVLTEDKYDLYAEGFYSGESKYVLFVAKIKSLEQQVESVEHKDDIEWFTPEQIEQLENNGQIHIRIAGLWALIKARLDYLI